MDDGSWRRAAVIAAILAAIISTSCLVIAWSQHAHAPAQRLTLAARPAAPVAAAPAPPAAASVGPPPAAHTGGHLYDVAWTDGQGNSWRTSIRLAAGAADVATRASRADQDQVRYRAKVAHDADGNVHIDARGAIVTGPLADGWAPDSFRIASDGSVRVDDHVHEPSEGWVVSVTRP